MRGNFHWTKSLAVIYTKCDTQFVNPNLMGVRAPNISTVSLCARLWLHPDAEWNVRGYIKIVEIWHADTILCMYLYIFRRQKSHIKRAAAIEPCFPFSPFKQQIVNISDWIISACFFLNRTIKTLNQNLLLLSYLGRIRQLDDLRFHREEGFRSGVRLSDSWENKNDN